MRTPCWSLRWAADERLLFVILNEVKSSPQGWFDIQQRVRMRSPYWILRCAQNDILVDSSSGGATQRPVVGYESQNDNRVESSLGGTIGTRVAFHLSL